MEPIGWRCWRPLGEEAMALGSSFEACWCWCWEGGASGDACDRNDLGKGVLFLSRLSEIRQQLVCAQHGRIVDRVAEAEEHGRVQTVYNSVMRDVPSDGRCTRNLVETKTTF